MGASAAQRPLCSKAGATGGGREAGALDSRARNAHGEGSVPGMAAAQTRRGLGQCVYSIYRQRAQPAPLELQKISLCSLKRHARTRPLARSWW